MPYLHLDLQRTYATTVKRNLGCLERNGTNRIASSRES